MNISNSTSKEDLEGLRDIITSIANRRGGIAPAEDFTNRVIQRYKEFLAQINSQLDSWYDYDREISERISKVASEAIAALEAGRNEYPGLSGEEAVERIQKQAVQDSSDSRKKLQELQDSSLDFIGSLVWSGDKEPRTFKISEAYLIGLAESLTKLYSESGIQERLEKNEVVHTLVPTGKTQLVPSGRTEKVPTGETEEYEDEIILHPGTWFRKAVREKVTRRRPVMTEKPILVEQPVLRKVRSTIKRCALKFERLNEETILEMFKLVLQNNEPVPYVVKYYKVGLNEAEIVWLSAKLLPEEFQRKYSFEQQAFLLNVATTAECPSCLELISRRSRVCRNCKKDIPTADANINGMQEETRLAFDTISEKIYAMSQDIKVLGFSGDSYDQNVEALIQAMRDKIESKLKGEEESEFDVMLVEAGDNKPGFRDWSSSGEVIIGRNVCRRGGG